MNRWYTGVWVSKNTTFPTSFGCEAFFKEYIYGFYNLYLFRILFFFFFFICLDVPHLTNEHEHKTASLADEGNSAYCQSSGAHNIKPI